MDIATPRNVQLSGFFRRSNAVTNAQERIPNCLTAIVNELNSKIPDIKIQYGEEAEEEMKNIIIQINRLKDEVLQDIPFRKLHSSAPDAKFYNDYLVKMTSDDCRPTMLQTVRVYAECYVYRRIWECFELTKHFKNFDPYYSMKNDLYQIAVPLAAKTAQYLNNIYQYPSEEVIDDFEKLIKLLLWSNQSIDVISKEQIPKNTMNILNIERKDNCIVSNQLREAWKVISDRNYSSDIIAIICGNVGFELFMVLCVADYLYTNYYARSIHFHVKHIPWFIADTTEKDINWMLHELSKSSDKLLQATANTWKGHFETGRWKIISRKYWVLPIGFSKIYKLDPVLYRLLQDSKMIILNGDLNYRKLLEDTNFDPTIPFSKVLCDFHPTNMMLIRIIKSNVVCDISSLDFERCEKHNKQWMNCGQYGLIQFARKPLEHCDCMNN